MRLAHRLGQGDSDDELEAVLAPGEAGHLLPWQTLRQVTHVQHLVQPQLGGLQQQTTSFGRCWPACKGACHVPSWRVLHTFTLAAAVSSASLLSACSCIARASHGATGGRLRPFQCAVMQLATLSAPDRAPASSSAGTPLHSCVWHWLYLC